MPDRPQSSRGSAREAHTTVVKRDGTRHAISDYDIDLAYALGDVGGIVCACGRFSEEVANGWTFVNDRPCCPPCTESLDELTRAY